MFENRSFDNLLGYAYRDTAPQRFVGAGEARYRGIPEHGSPLCNEAGGRSYCAQPAPYRWPRDMTMPNPDPGEFYAPHVLTQLYGRDWRDRDPATDEPDMSGFALDYIDNFHLQKKRDPTPAELQKVMNGFTPEALPVLTGLARSFAVSDAWHCSVPSQTMCNRSFWHSGQSHGFVTNASPPDGLAVEKWLANTAPTIFERLGEAGLDWRVYYDEEDLFPLTRLLHPQLLEPRFHRHFRGYHGRRADAGRFTADCRRGDLPAYTFVQPRLLFNHNDMHPPVPFNKLIVSSLLAGEILANNVYRALADSPLWKRSLLLVVFDEHGGCYDHVPPPRALPPFPIGAPPYPLQDGFGFDRLGVRVPMIAVSPWIEPGTVFRAPDGKNPFDHTSFLKTVCRRWKLPPLQARDASSRTADLGAVLGDRLRPDKPSFRPRRYLPCLGGLLQRFRPLHGMQRQLVALAHVHHGEGEPPPVRTAGEARDVLQSLRG